MADERTTFTQRGGPDWVPSNHDNTFSGLKTLRQPPRHLPQHPGRPSSSRRCGPETVTARARELGYDTVQPTLALALGSYEVTPLQHASALGSFANGGVHVGAAPYKAHRGRRG